MRLLGIDYGEKRVGVAISDEEGRVAFPSEIIENSPKLADEIVRRCRENSVSKVVLGESLDYSGNPNRVMGNIQRLKERLEELSGLEVELESEFMTSTQAEKMTGEKGGNDANAAALILQSYIDKKNG